VQNFTRLSLERIDSYQHPAGKNPIIPHRIPNLRRSGEARRSLCQKIFHGCAQPAVGQASAAVIDSTELALLTASPSRMMIFRRWHLNGQNGPRYILQGGKWNRKRCSSRSQTAASRPKARAFTFNSNSFISTARTNLKKTFRQNPIAAASAIYGPYGSRKTTRASE